MGLPSSGEISFLNVNEQLKRASTAGLSLNDVQVRGLAGKPTGGIAMSDLHGKWAGSHLLNLNQGDGTIGFKYNGAGQYIGQFAGCDIASLTWYPAEKLLWLRTYDGQLGKPSSTSFVVRDDNFNPIITLTLGAWAAVGTNGWESWSTLTAAAAPAFTHGQWRWITW